MPENRLPKVHLPHVFGPKYPTPHTAQEALERLLAGNQRFVEGHPLHPHASVGRRESIAQQGQHPFAVVVACADSREAPELIFDCGLGDLFVVRTAGHVVGNVALGSIEFGVLHLGIQLVLVLGHSHCGAIAAAVRAEQSGLSAGGHLGHLIDSIAPCVSLAQQNGGDLHEETMRLNVLQTAQAIAHTEVLQGLDGFQVIGGRYDIHTGEVHIFDQQAVGGA